MIFFMFFSSSPVSLTILYRHRMKSRRTLHRMKSWLKSPKVGPLPKENRVLFQHFDQFGLWGSLGASGSLWGSVCKSGEALGSQDGTRWSRDGQRWRQTDRPTVRPTIRPSVRPTDRPSDRPTVRPTVRPPDRLYTLTPDQPALLARY